MPTQNGSQQDIELYSRQDCSSSTKPPRKAERRNVPLEPFSNPVIECSKHGRREGITSVRSGQGSFCVTLLKDIVKVSLRRTDPVASVAMAAA